MIRSGVHVEKTFIDWRFLFLKNNKNGDVSISSRRIYMLFEVKYFRSDSNVACYMRPLPCYRGPLLVLKNIYVNISLIL